MSAFRIATVEAQVVRSLGKGGLYGMEICRKAKIKRGTVYVLLGRLIRKRLVKRRKVPGPVGPSLILHELTPAGKAFVAFLKIWQRSR